jgi:flap endonuclease-1
MGVKGVCTLIKDLAPEGISRRELSVYSRSTVAIDTSILLHKFSYTANKGNLSGDDIVSSFAKLCARYLSCNIRPVFVLDGPPPESKLKTIAQRSRSRANTSNYGKMVGVRSEDRTKVYRFLRAAGFDVIKSPCEAETMCAFLQKSGVVDYIYTDDADAFPLGCVNVLRNFANGSFDHIFLPKVLERLDLTMDQFVDLCILCGCDHCPSIPNVNYRFAYKMIKEHKSIENVLLFLKKEGFNIPINYDYIIAKKAFTDFSMFEDLDVNLKNKLKIEPEIRDFDIQKSLVHRLAILVSKYNNSINHQ